MTICSLTRKHRVQEKMSKITPRFLAEERMMSFTKRMKMGDRACLEGK